MRIQTYPSIANACLVKLLVLFTFLFVCAPLHAADSKDSQKEEERFTLNPAMFPLPPSAASTGDFSTKRDALSECGDGEISAGEECDDHNRQDGDGCSSQCEFESCGDGTVQVRLGEECDDSNQTDGDGCSSKCKIEQILVQTECGNGKKEEGEECDDDNLQSGDGCSSQCKIERCGDHVVQPTLGEECDGVDFAGGKVGRCSSSCKVLPPDALCGNNVVEAGEECDDGNFQDGDGCSALCKIEKCGNGILNFGEQCDDGNTSSNDGCSATCKTESCGDAIVQANEQCDDGNVQDGDSCSATCRWECGDGVQTGSEQCDDGNRTPGDGCNESCMTEFCGDGVIQTALGEQCDDGNTASGDGCSRTCQREAPVCGNHILESPEQCDDGNLTAGDGCNSSCQIEYDTVTGVCPVDYTKTNCNESCTVSSGGLEQEDAPCGEADDQWNVNNGTHTCSCPVCQKRACFSLP